MAAVPVLRLLVFALAFAPLLAAAAPVASTELEGICASAEDAADCARLIEEVQLKRLPSLARRDGKQLLVSLYPTGTATFTDSDDALNGRSYSLWDFLDRINAVLLYTSAGDTVSFTLLQRTSNRRVELPAEPQLAPDRARLVTADFCAARCVNEVAVWRIAPEGIHKEYAWSPSERWTDAAATWKDADTLSIEYTAAGKSGTIERRLADPGWKRVAAP